MASTVSSPSKGLDLAEPVVVLAHARAEVQHLIIE